MPFDVAFSLEDDERTAWVVALGELGGRRFDWSSRQWIAGNDQAGRR